MLAVSFRVAESRNKIAPRPIGGMSMSSDGLSLVGFIDDPATALNHLRVACVPVPANKPESALLADWAVAKGRLGAPIPSAGKPTHQSIPLSDPHIQQLLLSPWGDPVRFYLGQGAEFRLIEIDPLLAFQLTVDRDRSQHHCLGQLSSPPSWPELLELSFPLSLPTDPKHFFHQGNEADAVQSIIIRSRSLNLGIGTQYIPKLQPDNFAGIVFAWRLPVVHVVEFNGNCYLHNGFHRVCGAKLAGAAYIPCLYRKAVSPTDAGIVGLPATFGQSVLESGNPPTVGHFTQNRAFDVKLRATSRIIQITWSQHHIYEE
jgi:hypothetical protein